LFLYLHCITRCTINRTANS